MWNPYPFMMQGGPSIKEYEEFQDYLEKREKLKKEKDREKHKPKNFSFIETFILVCFLSIPVGMLTSWLAVMGTKQWMDTMQLYLK